MKNILLFTICFLTFGITFAQEEELSKQEKERREKNIQAGNPFAKFGYKAKVATLSKGKYLEVHDLDSIVKIGSSLWHVKKQKIVGNVEQDTTDIYRQPLFETAGRWLSPDPLAEEFPEWSPYNFVKNNPIRYVDPDGRAPVDWVDKNGNLVYDPSANNGKGGFTQYATQTDKNIAKQLRRTKTGEAQFQKLVNSDAKVQVVFNTTDEPTTENGVSIGGITDREGVTTASDMEGNVVDGFLESAVINLFSKNIDKLETAVNDDDSSTGANLNGTTIPDGFNSSEILGAIFGHEIEHTTKQNVVETYNGVGAETTPTKISDKILKETEELKNN